MNEATKTPAIRPREFYSEYMNGSVIDIGCGPDLVVPYATPFDQEQGDANHILDYMSPESFFCVHSSHCLEHMRNSKNCLQDWWALVKPGGYLITVVPDEDLYEQGYWPSLFNSDHKSTFRLSGTSKASPVSLNIRDLVGALPNAEIISAERQSNNYCHLKSMIPMRAPHSMRSVFFRMRRWIIRKDLVDTPIDWIFVRMALLLSVPVDQTRGKASAQIQVIARKRSE